MRIQLFSLVHQRIYFIIVGNICQLIFYTEQAHLERYSWLLLSFFVENIFSHNRRRTAPQKTSVATLNDCYALYRFLGIIFGDVFKRFFKNSFSLFTAYQILRGEEFIKTRLLFRRMFQYIFFLINFLFRID